MARGMKLSEFQEMFKLPDNRVEQTLAVQDEEILRLTNELEKIVSAVKFFRKKCKRETNGILCEYCMQADSCKLSDLTNTSICQTKQNNVTTSEPALDTTDKSIQELIYIAACEARLSHQCMIKDNKSKISMLSNDIVTADKHLSVLIQRCFAISVSYSFAYCFICLYKHKCDKLRGKIS